MTLVSRDGLLSRRATVTGAGRDRTPARTMRADARKVPASMTSEALMPENPTIVPPAAKPMTWANWIVVSATAVPVTYLSPSSTSA